MQRHRVYVLCAVYTTLGAISQDFFALCCRSDETKKHDHHDYDDEEDEEILGSDDDEQEDPRDYCKGNDRQ